MNVEYLVYYAGGNPTALIEGLYPADMRNIIGRQIVALDDQVEQVGFVYKQNETLFLNMAGNEFCGNATRCAVHHFMQNNAGDCKVQISVSGAPKMLLAGISGGSVWAQMPIIAGSAENSIYPLTDDYVIVKLHGITHLLVFDPEFKDLISDDNVQSALKDHALKLCDTYKVHNLFAVGIMFTERIATANDAQYMMHPIVNVKAIDTLYYESACGSGTTAVAMYDSFLAGCSKKVSVRQPSGDCISVDVSYEGNQFLDARLIGPVRRMYAGSVTIG